MATARQRRNRSLALGALALAAAGALIGVDEGARLYQGLLAGALLILAMSLGLRRRFLRVPLGSMSAWASAHLWLGALALLFGLLHARFRAGSALGVALLVSLVLAVASGLVGVVLQSIVPRLMTSRLPAESPLDDLRPLFAEHEQRILSLLSRVQRERGQADAGHLTLRSFHQQSVAPFFRAPLSPYTLLTHEAEATLAFDALRGGVDAGLHAVVDEIRSICDETRVLAEEGRLRRTLHGWLWVHIPAATIAVVLALAHALAAAYF